MPMAKELDAFAEVLGALTKPALAILGGARISGHELGVVVGHLTVRSLLHRGLLVVSEAAPNCGGGMLVAPGRHL